jgi:MoaA/NifB/PqqE/SkfB family radical SAM enzyme
MADISASDILKILYRGIRNYVTNRPLAISLEVTLSCNCNCKHCDLGGIVNNEKQLNADEYASLVHQFKPPIVQISGGEPLLRKDIVQIIKAIKHGNGTPYIILVTNGVLLDESLYLQLHNAGVNQLSVSLDFPDERMDDFRGHRGLFRHLNETIPKLSKIGYRDILLNTAITSVNVNDLLPIAGIAERWGVSISYSAYTPLRTGDPKYSVNDALSLEILRKNIYSLMEIKRHSYYITNSNRVFQDTIKYFEQGFMPNCKAGIRFFVVMPDGSFVPCSLLRHKFSNQKEMIENFSRRNKCGGCWVSMRSYTDKSLLSLLKDCPSYAKRLIALHDGYIAKKHNSIPKYILPE